MNEYKSLKDEFDSYKKKSRLATLKLQKDLDQVQNSQQLEEYEHNVVAGLFDHPIDAVITTRKYQFIEGKGRDD